MEPESVTFSAPFIRNLRNDPYTYRRGLMRYKFDVFYEMGSLAVVNVRDLANVKYAFKLLAFPDTKMFQCTSSGSKVLNWAFRLRLLVVIGGRVGV